MLKTLACGIRHSAAACALLTAAWIAQPAIGTVVSVAWNDLTPAARDRLTAAGVTPSAFPSYIDGLHRVHAQRVREGDLDHLVFYLLQSTHFTHRRPIEPALSAKTLVEGLPPPDREAFLRSGRADLSVVPASVRSRAADLIRRLDTRDADPRLAYFRGLAIETPRRNRETMLLREYLRAMRFLYQKEFVAQRAPDAAGAVADLYRARGFNTDTAVEAGYVVYLGLGVIESLRPDQRIRRVLIVGPGLDLAPRTGLLENGPPESYQPWAVIDALLALGLARLDDLEIVAADINPRVVAHLRRAPRAPPALRLIGGLRETPTTSLTFEYREYFKTLGRAIDARSGTGQVSNGHLVKTVHVDQRAARTLGAQALDIVTERLDAGRFDLVVATNVLPYFDDVELTLAVGNIASMLAPGGVVLHNEARPAMRDIARSAGLAFEQSRQAIIATVPGGPPLGDSVWIYRKPG